MVYVLWDSETNNLIAEFEDVDAAFAFVRRGIERNGTVDTDSLALEAEDDQGAVRSIAHGGRLADLARSVEISNR